MQAGDWSLDLVAQKAFELGLGRLHPLLPGEEVRFETHGHLEGDDGGYDRLVVHRGVGQDVDVLGADEMAAHLRNELCVLVAALPGMRGVRARKTLDHDPVGLGWWLRRHHLLAEISRPGFQSLADLAVPARERRKAFVGDAALDDEGDRPIDAISVRAARVHRAQPFLYRRLPITQVSSTQRSSPTIITPNKRFAAS